MDSMITTKDNLADFFKSPESAEEVNGLVEDFRYALIDYQVRTPKTLARLASNIRCRRRYNWISTTRAVSRSQVSLLYGPGFRSNL